MDFFHAVPVEVFNAGEYRRELFGAIHDAEFFDCDNISAVEKREVCNEACIRDMVQFLNTHSKGVVLYDAVNSTFKKRNDLLNKVSWYILYI